MTLVALFITLYWLSQQPVSCFTRPQGQQSDVAKCCRRADRLRQSALDASRPILSSDSVSSSSPRSSSSSSYNATTDDDHAVALSLWNQAEQLKAEIGRMRQEVAQSKEEQRLKEEANVAKWIQDLLFVASPASPRDNDLSVASNTQLLKTVDQVAQALEDGRYSAEQVNKIFRRLSDGIPKERVEQSLERQPLLQLLVEACGKLDCVERQENANKRWNGRVERDLRRKLFAMEWGIDLQDRQYE